MHLVLKMKAIDGANNDERKRKFGNDENHQLEDSKKRKSRFTEDDGIFKIDTTAAAEAAKARAMEISKSLIGKSMNTINPVISVQATNTENMLKLSNVAEMQAQLAAQIASVSSLLSSVQQQQYERNNESLKDDKNAADRKPVNHALRLDAQGREIDEYGQLVKAPTLIKSIAANVAVEMIQKKKENPYLAHRTVAKPGMVMTPGLSSGLVGGVVPPGIPVSAPGVLPPTVPGVLVVDNATSSSASQPIDDRIITSNRNAKARRALKFVEAIAPITDSLVSLLGVTPHQQTQLYIIYITIQ